jgi:hypothetical protein
VASLTLKNVPESLIELLRKAALAERRSDNQEALFLIEEGLRKRLGEPLPVSKPHVAAQIEAWEQLAGRWSSEKTVAEEVKGILDARTPGRPVDL